MIDLIGVKAGSGVLLMSRLPAPLAFSIRRGRWCGLWRLSNVRRRWLRRVTRCFLGFRELRLELFDTSLLLLAFGLQLGVLFLQLLKLYLKLLKLPFELAATTILQCNTGRFSFRWHDRQIVTEREFYSNSDLGIVPQ